MGFCRHVDVVHNLAGAAPLHQIFGVNAEKRKVQQLLVACQECYKMSDENS